MKIERMPLIILSPPKAGQGSRKRFFGPLLSIDRRGLRMTALLVHIFFLSTPAWPMGKRPPLPEEIPSPQTLPPLTLQDCYELALKQSETVAIQKEEIKEAEAQFFLAASEALGDITFEMTRRRQDVQKGGAGDGVGGSLSDIDRRERRFVFSQPLFQGFKALGALTGAGSLRRGEKEEWLRAKELLLLDVAHAFYGLLRQEKDLETLQEIHSLFMERIGELKQRGDIGRSRASEVVTAEARMKILEAELAEVRGLQAVARHLLEFLTGASFVGRPLIEEELPNDLSGELAPYVGGVDLRTDVEAARQSMKTAWRGVIVAQSGLWPELSIEHIQYERREGFQANMDWDFLFKVEVPLFQGGEALGNVKQAVSRWKQEKLTHAQVRREAEFEIKESYENWKAAIERNRAYEEAVRASRENFQLQKEEYRRNLVNNLDVLEALEALLETRRDANEAHYEMKENYWKLKVAAGALKE